MCVRVCAHAHIHTCFSGGQQVANKSVLQGRAQIVSASGAASSPRSECPRAKVDLFKRYGCWRLQIQKIGAYQRGATLSGLGTAFLAREQKTRTGTLSSSSNPFLAPQADREKAVVISRCSPGARSHAAILVPHRLLVPSRLGGRRHALGAAPTPEVLRGPAALGSQVWRPAQALSREALAVTLSGDPIPF